MSVLWTFRQIFESKSGTRGNRAASGSKRGSGIKKKKGS